MVDVGGNRPFREKWIQAFMGIHAILFLISCAEFDQNLREEQEVNRLRDALQLFQNIWRNRYEQYIIILNICFNNLDFSYLKRTSIVIFLNKQDILREKIKNGKQIEKYFPEYMSYDIDPEDADPDVPYAFQKARCFIRHKFNVSHKIHVDIS